MRRTLTFVLLLVVALSAQSQSKVTPKRATATKKKPNVVEASGERVSPPTQAAGPRLVVQLGQRTSIYGFAAFSRDGRLVATGGGGDVVVWDVGSGREVRRLVGNVGDPGAQDLDGLTGGAISPDNKLVAVAVGPNLRLWNLETGRLVWRRTNAANAFLVQEGGEQSVAFTDDGAQVVVRGDSARMVWDVATGKLVARTRLVKKGVADGVTEDKMFARNVTTANGAFVSEVKDGVVSVHDKKTGAQEGAVRYEEAGAAEANNHGLLAFALSPDGRRLVTAVKASDEGDKEVVRLWDVRTGDEERTLEGRKPGEAGALRFTSEGGLVAVSVDGEIIRARDLASGRAVEWTTDAEPSWVEVSSDGRFVVTAAGRAGAVWDARTGTQLARVEGELKAGEDAADFKWDFAGFTPDETVTFRKEGTSESDLGQTVRLSLGDWKEKRVNGLGPLTYVKGEGEKGFVLTRDARGAAWEIVVNEDGQPNKHFVTVWNADPNIKNKTFEVDRDEAYGDASGLALSPDGRKLVVVTANAGGNLAQSLVKVWDADAKRALFTLASPGFRVGSTVAWSPDGKLIATGADDGLIVLWDAATGKELRRLKGLLATAVGVEFSPDSRLLMASSGEGVWLLVDVATGAEVCRLVTFADGGWLVVDPQGRFDADDLADMRGAHWVAPDDPLRPLPLEIFMRDYYEPRLLARLLAGERFAPVRALAELNRVQPRVSVSSVEQQKERPELVNVTVEVERGVGAKKQEAGVYDLRLFRDGQLVGHAPEGAGGEVKTDLTTGKATITFRDIRLPRRASLQHVEFTAYAFNQDRVKSETARRVLTLKAAPAQTKGRAYVVSVGVNAYEDAKWDLRFAANDARRLQEVVAARVAASNEYAEIVRVPLVSDYEFKDGKKTAPRVLTEATATKANFRAVLDLLAGREVDAATRAKIPNADKLRQAAPEDLVIISFSSHGYADERGNFYLLPYDTGAGAEMRDVLGRAISSDELSLWLREVDAGELVLVVDACHSAASVQGEGFKPGPMGSRGLGQLSYDKGMRVLTSTQADNVALETELTEQGLLTFALTREGLEAARADFSPPDGSITVAEWLAYGVERVPALFEEVGQKLAEMQAGRGAQLSSNSAARVVVLSPGARELGVASFSSKTQRPSLFDYARNRRAAVLSKR